MLWMLRPTTQLAQPCLRRTFTSTYFRRLPRAQALSTNGTASTTSAAPLSFREQVARRAEPKSFSDHVQRPRIARHILFAVLGSYAAFSLAAIETNRDTAYWTKKIMDSNPFNKFYAPTSVEIARVRYQKLGKSLQKFVTQLKDELAQISGAAAVVILWPTVRMAQSFLDATEGRRTAWALCAINGVVWVAWLIPRLRPIMSSRFTHDPLSGKAYTMLTSVFSHQSIFHLGFNCMALASFGTSAHLYLTSQQNKNPYGMQESSANWHFVAFFISAGLFSALVSHVVSARFMFPRMVAQLSRAAEPVGAQTTRVGAGAASSGASVGAKVPREILPSLGASGAIYAAVTLTALAFPDAVVSLIFPPTWPIPIQTGVGALVLIDVLGVIRGWRMFDHWAHLGGAAFGALYYAYGPQLWTWMRVTNGGVTNKAYGLTSSMSPSTSQNMAAYNIIEQHIGMGGEPMTEEDIAGRVEEAGAKVEDYVV